MRKTSQALEISIAGARKVLDGNNYPGEKFIFLVSYLKLDRILYTRFRRFFLEFHEAIFRTSDHFSFINSLV